MPFLEGLSLALAQLTWLPTLTDRRVEIVTDCEPFLHAARRQYSRDDDVLELLQALAMMRAMHNVSVRYVHVSSEDNVVDELSRGDEQAFLRRCPGALPSNHMRPSLVTDSWKSVFAQYWVNH
jgi:acyl carrier protein phosphodiesterase